MSAVATMIPTENEQATTELDWMFPTVDCGHMPLGTRVVVQLRGTKKKSAGGLILVDETKETEKWNTQVAKVVLLGSLAYRNRETREFWPEGAWVKIGDFVRIPRWGGDRWEVMIPGRPKDEPALFVTFNDHELISRVTGDPLAIKAFIL